MGAVALNGMFVGVIYGLIGVGLVLIYQGSRVINFSYGETGMIAAFLFVELRFPFADLRSTSVAQVHQQDATNLLLALPAAVAIGGAIGLLTEVLIIRRLRHAPRITPLVGTFAVGALLFTFGVRRYTQEARSFPPVLEGEGVRILGLQVQPSQTVILVVAAVVLAVLGSLYRFTSFGLRLRATAMDPYAAGLVGVNVNNTSMAVWTLGGALAALSAILIAPLVAFHVAFMAAVTIRGMAAALLAGLSRVGGAFVAGVVLGVTEALIAFKTPVSGITDLAIAVLVLVTLLARPSGVFRRAGA